MNDKAKAMRAEYARQWRKKNKDKERATRERYWEKKAREAEAAENQEAEKGE